MGYIINYIQSIDPASMTLPLSVYIIWACTLLIILVIIVPLAVILLHRTLTAAWSIRRYMADMLVGGADVAENTASISALNNTISVTTGMVKTAKLLDGHSATIGEVLAQRVAGETK